jgi:hypothetical protein
MNSFSALTCILELHSNLSRSAPAGRWWDKKTSTPWHFEVPERLALKSSIHFPSAETLCVPWFGSDHLKAILLMGEACYGPINITGRKRVKTVVLNSGFSRRRNQFNLTVNAKLSRALLEIGPKPKVRRLTAYPCWTDPTAARTQ